MADNKNDFNITNNPAWLVVAKFAEDEIKAKEKQIIATLKSGEVVDINKTFADLKCKAGAIQALEMILAIPQKILARNKENKELK